MAESQKKTSSLNLKLLFVHRKYLLATAVVAACTILTIMSIVLPRLSTIQSNLQLLQTEQAKLQTLEEKRNFLRNIESVNLYAQKELIMAVLPSYKPILPIIKRYEDLARESQIIVSEFELKPGEIATQSADTKKAATAAVRKDLDTLDVNLKLLGEINNINTFLTNTERVSPLTDFNSIRLTQVTRRGAQSSEADENLRVFEVTVTFSTYFYQGVPQLNPDKNLPEISVLSEKVLDQLSAFQLPATQIPAFSTEQRQATSSAHQLF